MKKQSDALRNLVRCFNLRTRFHAGAFHHVPTLCRVSKPIRVLLSGLLLSITAISTSHAALSAQTANTIEGTAPYLSTTLLNKINSGTDFELLGVDFDGNSYFTSHDINTKLTASGISFTTFTPNILAKTLGDGTSGVFKAAYKTPVAMTDAIDDDGDGFATGSLTGTASVGWYYMNGTTETALTIGQKDQTFCDLADNNVVPYLKIEGPVKLSTPYGIPNEKDYDMSMVNSPLHTSKGGAGKNPLRRFYLSGEAVACYAKPNLKYGDNNDATGNGILGKNFAGPTSQWDPNKGFKLQNKFVPSSNFPTMGANGLFFDLTISGSTATDIINASETVASSGIVEAISPTSVKLKLSVQNTNVVRVTLIGPNDSSNGGSFTPSTFKLYSDNAHSNIIYSFKLDKWFVARQGSINLINGKAYCNNLLPTGSYRLPSANDYTNAGPSFTGFVGSLVGWTNNYYQRHISKHTTVSGGLKTLEGGLFSEWGYIANSNANSPYIATDFDGYYYWVHEYTGSYNYDVIATTGMVDVATSGFSQDRIACIIP